MDITYWCPKESSLKKERIYGEKWLRFSYENLLGRIGLWAMVKRTWFSKWYGSQMNRLKSREKIKPFIKKYDLDESEFLSSADSYRTFNEFFIENYDLRHAQLTTMIVQSFSQQMVGILLSLTYLKSIKSMQKAKVLTFLHFLAVPSSQSLMQMEA